MPKTQRNYEGIPVNAREDDVHIKENFKVHKQRMASFDVMTISIYPSMGEHKPGSVYYLYLLQSLLSLADNHPQHSFLINHPLNGEELPSNFSILTPEAAKSPWYRRLFSRNPGTEDERRIQSFPSRLISDNFLLLPDLTMLAHPELFSKNEIGKWNRSLKHALSRSKAVLLHSPFYIKLLTAHFPLNAEKIRFMSLTSHPLATAYSPVQKENIKAIYTKGLDYFVFAGDLHPRFDFIAMLKAFSHFKKWQRSGMKLVIATGQTLPQDSELNKLVSTFKYRDDVVMVDRLPFDTLLQLIAGAYCFLYPALYDPFPWHIQFCMSVQTAVISYDIAEIRAFAPDALIYVEPNESSLAAAMQRVYKEERWRSIFTEKALDQFEEIRRPLPGPENRMLFSELMG